MRQTETRSPKSLRWRAPQRAWLGLGKGGKTMRGLSHVVVAAALAGAAAVPARAQDYPTAPVHIISGFPASTTADISARVVGAKIGQILRQQLVVENRPG